MELCGEAPVQKRGGGGPTTDEVRLPACCGCLVLAFSFPSGGLS
jgi:hypothetical protein